MFDSNPVRRDFCKTFREISYKYNTFRVCRYNVAKDGMRELVICNIWKLSHAADGRFSTWWRSHETFRWQRMRFNGFLPVGYRKDADKDNCRLIPDFPMDPLERLSLDNFHVRTLLWTAFLWCVEAAKARVPIGDKELVICMRGLFGVLFHAKLGSNPLSSAFTPAIPHIGGKTDVNGFLGGCVLMRKTFHQEFCEKPVYSGLVSISGERKTLRAYAHAAAYADGLLRVMRERRNCLPLLRFVPLEHWNDSSLFDAGLPQWPRYRRTEIIDAIKASPHRRWILRQPQKMMRIFATAGSERELFRMTEFIRTCGINKPIAVFGMFFADFPLNLSQERMRALFFAYRNVVIEKARRVGMRVSRKIRVVADFLVNNNSLIRDFIAVCPETLDIPHIGWNRILELTDEWHRQQWVYHCDHVHMDTPFAKDEYWGVPWAPDKDDRDLWWRAPFSCAFRKRTFTELVTTIDLRHESWNMAHCAVTYPKRCCKGYRIFHFTGLNGKPYTLGVKEDGAYEQCYGFENSEPPENEIKAAKAFSAMLMRRKANAVDIF